MNAGGASSTVTESALIRRINRKLAKDGESLHKARPFRDSSGLEHFDSNIGEFYIVNDHNTLIASHVDLDALGRELGVLAQDEVLS